MKQNGKRRIVMSLLLAMSLSAMALPTNLFATSSRLSSGRWVRISVPEDGVYELTQEELSGMGFNDIDKVAIYGCGGYVLDEVLNGTAPDDLQPLAAMKIGNKLYFYGKGPVKMWLEGLADNQPHFERKINSYSLTGNYFLTEESSPLRMATRSWLSQNGGQKRDISYGCFYHERDLETLSRSGKDFFGESFFRTPLLIDYTLPNLASNDIFVQMRAGISYDKKNQDVYFKSSIISGGQTVKFGHVQNKTGENNYFEDFLMQSAYTLPSRVETGQLLARDAAEGETHAVSALFDYAIITYKQYNRLGSNAQMKITMTDLSLGDTIVVTAPSGTQVWNVDKQPVAFQTLEAGSDVMIAPSAHVATAQFVAFNPSVAQKKVSSFEVVPNQNIHGRATPDLVIISHQDLLAEAERVADMHRITDNLDVAVYTPEQVYNEFSSGTPDAMAIRLMCKMFYDRAPKKFKYLMLLGQASFDQRNVIATKPCMVITYESDNSNKETESYGCDDFFGFLDDGSGETPESDVLRIGVGRITSNSVMEAKSDVDKLLKYVTEPDYGPWRANVFLAADQGDNDIYIWQAEGFNDLFMKDNHLSLAVSKDYIPMFGKAVNEPTKSEDERSSPEANRYMKVALDQGQFFATYMGHASQTVFTKKSHLWTVNNAKTVNYSHWPIFTTACCDATHYDSGKRGIAEHMLHNANGGAISVMASTRSVYAESNYNLNTAFANALFSAGTSGTMTTLGQAYMKAKQWFAGKPNFNKMMYVLLGDPAMKINYPRPLMRVTKVNNTDVTSGKSVTVHPMQQVTVEADVRTPSGELDTGFTGEATLTVYGAQRQLRDVTFNYEGGFVTKSIKYPRAMLSQIQGQVVKGKFTAKTTLPRDLLMGEGAMMLHVYAHKAGTSDMVSGAYYNLEPGTFDEAVAIKDDTPPVIKSIYLNDAHDFAYNNVVNSSFTLHVEVSDDVALSNEATGISGGVRLFLDNGKETYFSVKNHAVLSDNGRQMTVECPLSRIPFGEHTLTFQVYDVAGNATSQTISFVVAQTTALSLVPKEYAVKQQATFEVASMTLPGVPRLTLHVLDVNGNLVWETTPASFPYTWDLKGLNGKRVTNGVYRYYATYDTMDHYGGTPMGDFVVVEP